MAAKRPTEQRRGRGRPPGDPADRYRKRAFSLPPKLDEQLAHEASKGGETVSGIIQQALTRELRRRQARRNAG